MLKFAPRSKPGNEALVGQEGSGPHHCQHRRLGEERKSSGAEQNRAEQSRVASPGIDWKYRHMYSNTYVRTYVGPGLARPEMRSLIPNTKSVVQLEVEVRTEHGFPIEMGCGRRWDGMARPGMECDVISMRAL